MLKPINGKIICERLAARDTFCGMSVSDGAKVKNVEAIVRFVCDESQFNIGDIVHLPHYDTQYEDVTYGDKSLTILKEDEIIGVLWGTEYHPVNGYVRVRKCENDHIRDSSGAIALYMTENHIETTEWCEVVDVANDCKHIKPEHIGLFCVAPESSEKLQRILYSKDFMLHENLITWLTTGD